jgi:hypothetical protein
MPDTEPFYYITKLHAKQTLAYVFARQYATRLTNSIGSYVSTEEEFRDKLFEECKQYSDVCYHLLHADNTRYVALIVSKLYCCRVACELSVSKFRN